MFAELIDQVASGVQIEPPLKPLTVEILPSGSITTDEARLDIAAKANARNGILKRQGVQPLRQIQVWRIE